MTTVYIIEAQLIDHPEYEVFDDVTGTKEAAEKIVLDQLQDELNDMGDSDDSIRITATSDKQTRYEITDGGSVMFITSHEI